jgi:hypothetical protein
VRAAFNRQKFWVETDVQKLVELDEGHEPFFRWQLQHQGFFSFDFISILYENLGLAYVIRQVGMVSNLLHILTCSSGFEFVLAREVSYELNWDSTS